jgi:hypothetical protein
MKDGNTQAWITFAFNPSTRSKRNMRSSKSVWISISLKSNLSEIWT